jgi:capsular exopolysaccharide synthesis family protein
MTDNPLGRYLVPLRRWWPIVAGAVVLGLVVAWVTLPERPEPGEQVVVDPEISYQATHLLLRGRPTPATDNFELVALLARQGEIPQQVEAELGDEVAPGSVAAVLIEPNQALGTIGVTAVQPTPELAVRLANAYAEALVGYFDEQADESQQEQIERVTERLQAIDIRVRELETQLEGVEEGSLDADLIEAELNVLTQQFGVLQTELRDLSTGAVASQSTFDTLQEPVPVSTTTPVDSVFEVPDDSRSRLALAAALALILGLGVVFAVDWVDTRVRTREDAEDAFGLPVIAELPRLRKKEREEHPLPVHSDPGSVAAETFRALRLSVLRTPRWRLDRPVPTAQANGTVGSAAPITGAEQPGVILVTSARDSEGKSTVAANLAASIAETGKRVLLLDADFRRPSVGNLVGVPAGPGLRELRELEARSFAKAIVGTEIPNLSLMRSGSPGIAPAWFLVEADRIIEQAQEFAEVVVIDSGPLLATNEAATLIPSVDALLLVTKSGRLSRQQARHATEQLTRLGALVSGIVMVGAEGTRKYGYYEPIRRAAATGEPIRPT